MDLLVSLEKHIESETIRLAKLKEVAQEFQRISDHATANIESYLAHPVDQYRYERALLSTKRALDIAKKTVDRSNVIRDTFLSLKIVLM